MPRRRLGVALLLDPPLADEIDGLRRAVGDRALGRIPPHVTLVPPVNVAERDLASALARLRDAAASVSGPMRLVLGPPATFLPDNPVLHLPVGGDTDALGRVRATVFAGPLSRPEAWPWTPHVTLADEADPARLEAALRVLGGYQAGFEADRLVLLEERKTGKARRWRPLADAVFGPRLVVGRGGLELELTLGRLLDPEAAALLRALPELPDLPYGPEGPFPGPEAPPGDSTVPLPAGWTVPLPAGWTVPLPAGWGGLPPAGEEAGSELGERRAPFPLLCVARRQEGTVGVGAAWWSDWRGHLGVAVDPAVRGQGIGSQILARLESVLADAGWDGPELETVGAAGFYRRSRLAAGH
jgi:2'-5' RNA ligase/GNAT superfamily N-acetyltransferase